MKLLWLTDLHLDRTHEKRRASFYERVRKMSADAVVITGDISDARHLPGHLRELGRTFQPRPVYFVLGNHDFFGSGFADVDRAVAALCTEQANLHHLGQGEIIRLGAHDALIGHRGWADGRAGWGMRSFTRNPDFDSIRDFRGRSRPNAFGLMEKLGRTSGNYFREVLPYALSCYSRVWLATHVPPFTWAAFYDGKPCDCQRQPFFSNISAGGVIRAIAGNYHERQLTVLCGHTHSPAAVKVGSNIEVFAGGASLGVPDIQRIFSLK